MKQAQEPLIDDGVFPTPPKKFLLGLVVGGIVLLGLGVLGGVMLKRFVFVPIQPLTEEEQVFCGGWDSGGEIICDCSGKLIKPDCPAGVICDSGNYFCQGQCGNCCWRGGGGTQYGGPYPVCGSDKFFDRVCELGKEYESNAADGPDCQCPVGFQPEIIDMSWGPCPGDGRIRDCPSSRFKCSKEESTSGAEVEL